MQLKESTLSLSNPVVQHDVAGMARELAAAFSVNTIAAARAREVGADTLTGLAALLAAAKLTHEIRVAFELSPAEVETAARAVADPNSAFNRTPPLSDRRVAELHQLLYGN
jgi:hypothetical protein